MTNAVNLHDLIGDGPEQGLGEVPATNDEFLALLKLWPHDTLKIWPVDKAVGNVGNKRAQLLTPIELTLR